MNVTAFVVVDLNARIDSSKKAFRLVFRLDGRSVALIELN